MVRKTTAAQNSTPVGGNARPQRKRRLSRGPKEWQGRVIPPRTLTEAEWQQEEQLLDQRLRERSWVPEDMDPKLWAEAREFHRVNTLFPNKHVIFRDRWEGRGNKLRLVKVDVLLVTDDF